MKKILLSLAIALCMATGSAQNTDTRQGSFDERIRTLQIHPADAPLMPALLLLGSPGYVEISFDQLGDDREYFRWRLVHCDAAWSPDDLADAEFTDTFNEEAIEDYRYSEATSVPYVHYSFTVPGDNLAPKISGNYLVQVYRDDDPDRTIAQFRLPVSEQTAPVSGTVSPVTDVDYRDRHQQLEINVNTEDEPVQDLFNDLKIVVSQNERPETERTIVRPLTVSGHNLTFAHSPALIFPAGNEYRRFETVNEYYPGMGVDRIEYLHPYRNFILQPDTPRSDARYQYDQTQQGAYVVRRSGANDSDVEADYAVVHFSFEHPDPSLEVFIEGDLTDRRTDPSMRMHYDPATNSYRRALLLKQGSYNYQYLTSAPAGASPTAETEGDKWETRNRYTVKVYHRRRGERHDRLIGVGYVQ